jgi:hypothetical protein
MIEEAVMPADVDHAYRRKGNLDAGFNVKPREHDTIRSRRRLSRLRSEQARHGMGPKGRQSLVTCSLVTVPARPEEPADHIVKGARPTMRSLALPAEMSPVAVCSNYATNRSSLRQKKPCHWGAWRTPSG